MLIILIKYILVALIQLSTKSSRYLTTSIEIISNLTCEGESMEIIELKAAKKTFPTGNPNFSVMQAFPAGISSKDSDPFLMCDYFSMDSTGKSSDPDDFPVPWHPHRGMDIMTYLIDGVGRHADSLGNREEFNSPGMQWISVGSGIEHAEGGGTPSGGKTTGFQIWINVPGKNKMDDPRYGTESPSQIPNLKISPSESALLLAGSYGGQTGPFKTVQPVLMMDYRLSEQAEITHTVDAVYDNCMIYVYKGNGLISNQSIKEQQVVRLNASNHAKSRDIHISAGAIGMSFLIFSGKKLNENIAWHGPFVMNTNAEIETTIAEFRSGKFPPIRAPWNYKSIHAFPDKSL